MCVGNKFSISKKKTILTIKSTLKTIAKNRAYIFSKLHYSKKIVGGSAAPKQKAHSTVYSIVYGTVYSLVYGTVYSIAYNTLQSTIYSTL